MRPISLEPRGDINLLGFEVVDLHRIAIEQIRQHGEVSISGESVGEELAVGEDAEDVGEEEKGGVGRGRGGEVGEECEGGGRGWEGCGRRWGIFLRTVVDGFYFSCGDAIVLEAGEAAGPRRVGGHVFISILFCC